VIARQNIGLISKSEHAFHRKKTEGVTGVCGERQITTSIKNVHQRLQQLLECTSVAIVTVVDQTVQQPDDLCRIHQLGPCRPSIIRYPTRLFSEHINKKSLKLHCSAEYIIFPFRL